MPRPSFPFRPALILPAILLLAVPPAGHAQTQDAEVAQLQAALAANRGNQAVQQCVEREPAIERYNAAVDSLAHVGDPGHASLFNCSGIGTSWQEVAPAACCSVYERDKSRSGAWNALQACGLRDRILARRPAYVQAVNKCLAASGATTAAVPQPAGPPARSEVLGGLTQQELDLLFARMSLVAWAQSQGLDQVRPQIIGRDAFAVTSSAGLRVLDNAGRERAFPGFLADRVHSGFTVLDDHPWLETVFTTLVNISTSERRSAFIDWVLHGAPGARLDQSRQFIWFDNTFVRLQLGNASLSVIVGEDPDSARQETCTLQRGIRRISSEHSSVRGCINGGGDFIKFSPGGARQGPAGQNVRLELPGALVAADGDYARVVADLAPSGASAVAVVTGRVNVREMTTGQSRMVSRGEAVLILPGTGVSQPARVSADRFAAASRPRIRGSIVLQPGEEWSGQIRLDAGLLPIEARLLYDKPAGGNYVLEVAVNGKPVTDPVLNKMSPMRYADGRNYPYREPNSAKWLLFYSHDYAANNGAAGGGYEVKTDPGQAYRYVWNVASLAGKNAVADVRFRNSSNPPVPLELRLLSAEVDNRYTSVAPLPPAPQPEPAKPRSGWGAVFDTLKDAAREITKPSSTTTGATTPAATPPEAMTSPYATPPAQGQPRLAVFAVERILAHSDFAYPVVVQLQDGSGRPMYPATPLSVTVTTSDVSVVRMYGAGSPGTTSVTLRPADRSGADGLSWESVRVTAANNWVSGRATITATAPGFPAASMTLVTVPTRTQDNRNAPAQTAPAARVTLIVMPPVVEVNRRPVIYMDLVDANGQPTGVDFGPGEWTLTSSNPAVFPTSSSTGRNVVLDPVGPGQAQLTLTSKRPGVAGSSATLTVVAPGGAPVITEYVAPSAAPTSGAPHLAIHAVGQILAHSDFAYPVVVQLQDGSGRPMYPATPLTVTVTSSDVSVVRLYGASAPGTTSVTLRPADRSGADGLSWESVRVAAANNWVSGRATITATAPGFPAASMTLVTVPTRTQDNRNAPAQTAPAARVALTVMPPVVEVNRRPVIYMDLVDANGQPTGVDFGPGDWTLTSSNPAVFPTSSSTGRSVVLDPVGPGQAQLTVTSKRPGVAGSSATLTVVAPGGAPVTTQLDAPHRAIGTAAQPAPAPGGTTGRLADFGDPAPSPGRLSNIVTARAVRNGVAIDITDRFTPDVNPIHVWFRVSGFGFGTTLLSKWTYLGGQQPLVIGTADVVLEPANDWATFNYELAPGKRWPAGEYLVEILLGNSVVGRTTFEVIR